MAVLLVDIHVNDNGTVAIRKFTEEAKKAESSTNSLRKSSDNLGSSFTSLQSTLKSIGFAAAAYEVAKLGKYYVETADKMTTVESRLRLVTSSIEEQTKAHKELFNISQQTRLGFKETADLYSRIAIATKDYNISQDKLLSITGTINKAMIVSGGTAESMNNAIIQLGQAFSGNFQSVGQELASIREQTPALYQAIVAGSGMTSQAFKKAAEDGELSTEIIIKALEKQASAVDKDFDKMLKTVGQSMTTMSNSLMELIGFIDKSTGASSSLSESITSISSSIDNFTKTLKNSNTELDSLAKKGNIKLEDNGILASILKANQGAGDALYKVLSETLGIVDKTAGEWSKIIDSSYSGMSKWVESVAGSLGIVEEKAKSTKKSIDSIVPSRPTVDNYTLVEDLPDRFTNRLSKKQEETSWSELFGVYKKEQDDKLKLQKKGQEDSDKLYEEWAKRKLELTYENEIAQSDELAKPFILLEKKYKEDLDHFKGNQEAKNLLTQNYYIEAERLQKDTIEKFNKQEEEKYKKSNEWQVKLFEANEKINDQFIAQREKMYGATSDIQIEAWYQNQLEWLGKLSLEGKATSEELQGLLDKINSLKNLKVQEQTLSFKLEKGFYTSFENSLTNSIENAFNGDSLDLNSFFKNIRKQLTNTLASDISGGIVNNFKTFTGFGGAASLVGSTLSASDMSSLLSSGATASDGVIKTAGGTVIDQASGTVTSQGSDALSLLNTASSLKTAYGLISNGISGSIISGFQSVSGLLAQAGFGSASSGLMSFGAGVANPFAYAGMSGLPTAMTAGSMLSGGLIGGAVGYGTGWLGDKIFGADTYAGTTGAIGGALGGLGGALGLWGGPIGIIAGSIIGSVLGGIFGKTKQTGAGIDILGNATADSASGQYWTSYKKKSWFSSKSWTNYTPFSDEEIEAIKSTIGVYDYLLAQLGEYNDLVVSGGRFSNLQSFLDTNVVKAFLVSINPNNLSTIYQSWVDYAAEIDKTITEALATAVSGYTTYKRGYTEWFLGSGTVEQLAFTSNYLQKDFEALASSLGASSVTVDNFLSMYDAAIKNNFTQDTIEAWASLGDALMKSTDATKKYKDALDSLNGSTTYSLPVDTMLTKVNNTSQQIDLKSLVSQQNNQNESIKSILFESLKSLKQLLKYEQMRITQ